MSFSLFQLFGDAMCKYSEECPNAIVHASLIPKQDIQVMWKAPQAGTGCVVFKCVSPFLLTPFLSLSDHIIIILNLFELSCQLR